MSLFFPCLRPLRSILTGQAKKLIYQTSSLFERHSGTCVKLTPVDSNHSENTFGIYVHVPFCASKCPYCDFVSACATEARHKTYLDALRREILDSPYAGSEAVTLYLGGGTPSELRSAELDLILESISVSFSFSTHAEWTIECNPNSAAQDFLCRVRSEGFNRLSLGVQSFNNKHLKRLGRLHRSEDTLEAYRSARRSGFDNINADLIFAIPGQTIAQWKEDLKTLLTLSPEHLSLYCLTIESQTEFGKMVESALLKPVGPDSSADMFELSMDLTSRSNYQHYEISNYARTGFESSHNLRYWRNEPYLGFGLSAASYVDGVRWTNTSDWNTYERSAFDGHVARATQEKLTGQHALAEEMMLLLRTRWGFSAKILSRKYDCDLWEVFGDPMEFFIEERLLEISGENLRLTRKGILVADEICRRILQIGEAH